MKSQGLCRPLWNLEGKITWTLSSQGCCAEFCHTHSWNYSNEHVPLQIVLTQLKDFGDRLDYLKDLIMHEEENLKRLYHEETEEVPGSFLVLAICVFPKGLAFPLGKKNKKLVTTARICSHPSSRAQSFTSLSSASWLIHELSPSLPFHPCSDFLINY